MIVKLLTEHHLEFISLKGGYRGLSKSTHAKMPHGWKSCLGSFIFLFFLDINCEMHSQINALLSLHLFHSHFIA